MLLEAGVENDKSDTFAEEIKELKSKLEASETEKVNI